MTKINIIRPPKISVDACMSFLNQLLMIIVGTTISLGFTIAAAKLTSISSASKTAACRP